MTADRRSWVEGGCEDCGKGIRGTQDSVTRWLENHICSQNSGEEKKPAPLGQFCGRKQLFYPCACKTECENYILEASVSPSNETKPSKRHPASSRFHEILESLGELHDRKQSDYGLDNDPFANVRASQSWGMPAWVGAMVRATDKVRRLQTFARKGELRNESVIDAFDDLAVYAIIARVLYEQELENERAIDAGEYK